jgi:hypothetical protein
MDTGGNDCDAALCALLSVAPMPVKPNASALTAALTSARLLLFLKLTYCPQLTS